MDNNSKLYLIISSLSIFGVIFIWMFLSAFNAEYNDTVLFDESFDDKANLEEEKLLQDYESNSNYEVSDNPEAFANDRDTTRRSDLNSIATALSIFIANGNSISKLGSLPICNNSYPIGKGAGMIDLSILVPDFISSIPTDPTTGTKQNSGYAICVTTENTVRILAPNAEIINEIKVEL